MPQLIPLLFLCLLGADAPAATILAATDFQEPTGALSLRDATAAALQANPRLAAFAWELRAVEAEQRQAAVRPNPELDVEIEDIRWSPGPTQRSVRGAERERESGAPSGFAESEVTVSLSQVIELGGKRAKRIALSERQTEVAQWDFEAVRADVLGEVALAFMAVLIAQERRAIAEELTALAEDVARSIALRVDAGSVSPIEGDRAQIARATAATVLERTRYELDASRSTLAATWGSRGAHFIRAAGDVNAIRPIAPVEALADTLKANPDWARWATEVAAREAQVALERVRRVPDPTLTLGFRSTGLGDRRIRHFGGGASPSLPTSVDFDSARENSLVLGFSLPLPLFDRNQGNIEAARYRVARTDGERIAVEIALWAELSRAQADAAAAFAEAVALRSDVLDAAQTFFDKTRMGYEEGKFSYLEVLDAQRTLVDTKTVHLDALERYHNARIHLERLTGVAPDTWAMENWDHE